MIKILIISELKLGIILIYKWLEEKHETNFLRSFTKLSCTSIFSIDWSRKNKQSTIFFATAELSKNAKFQGLILIVLAVKNGQTIWKIKADPVTRVLCILICALVY